MGSPKALVPASVGLAAIYRFAFRTPIVENGRSFDVSWRRGAGKVLAHFAAASRRAGLPARRTGWKPVPTYCEQMLGL
jgi:hypothetical protein